ncbi:polysaccharide biosynthesis tyrosine autokinase [Mangrovimonas sp. CR14]|uniref:GumC family protein n=1 Tax=Mangrovimonas sp. CR14 TaxID=2706120 RepID=UPI001420CAEE|nr:polysaccharide biosynthesis tyrosine autokinase [Mangrovimonas sp. CR14]NIK91903.1 polysaccharide biosynthesis tyrosine autokinase [Mangrovimonas sp. CR14]
MKQKDSFREILSPYLLKWKFILICLIGFMALVFLYLRYTDYLYQASATIKLKDDKSNSKLPELNTLQNYGLFKTNNTNVLDEIEVIKSRTIITEAIKDLKFNIQYFVEGRINDHETYSNPPISINFSEPDSLIYKVDTTLTIKINSGTQFLLKGADFSKLKTKKEKDLDDEGTIHNFGEPVTTSFGDITITPRIGEYAAKIGSRITVKISPIEKVASDYKGKLILENKETSNVIKLSIKDHVKEKASLFLDKLIEKYNEDIVKDKELVVQATSDFINSRLEIVSEELGEVDLTAESLQKENKLTDLQTQSSLFLQNEKENESQIIQTANQIQLIDYMSDHLSEKGQANDLLPANIGISDNSVALITKKHNELVLERNRLLKNSSDKNPTVVNLTNQIDQLKANLQESLSSIKSTNQITYNNLVNENQRINSQIYSAPKKQRQFRDIKRQQDIKEALYLYLLEKREEAAITHGVSSPNAKIVDKAYVSNQPVSPKVPLILLAGLILGLAVPVGFVYLIDLLDDKVHNISDIKKALSVPFIGDIPRSNKKQHLISKVDYSPKAEAFRMVRTNIDFMLQNISDRAKIIFVTSTTSKEGKSHSSINLALSLAYSDKKVLLIETDIRVPRATNYLDVENKTGVTNFIGNHHLDIHEVISKYPGSEYLDIIPSGTIPPNPAELLMSHRVKDMFDSVKNSYDYIIVDTAAVGLVTDTLLISKFADLFIYVVRANYLRKDQLEIAQRMYDEKRLPNMAILLNGVDHKRGYGYGYGYGKMPSKKKAWWKFK